MPISQFQGLQHRPSCPEAGAGTSGSKASDDFLISFVYIYIYIKHLPCCWNFSSSIFDQKKPPSCRDQLTTENVKATESLNIWRCPMDPNPNGRYVMSKNPWNLPMALPVEGPTKKTSGCGRSYPVSRRPTLAQPSGRYNIPTLQ